MKTLLKHIHVAAYPIVLKTQAYKSFQTKNNLGCFSLSISLGETITFRIDCMQNM